MGRGYEIDFLSSGSGEAISVRYGTPGNYKVMVYECATEESGEKLVEHVRWHYGTDRVDFAVCSHPDVGRASGLSVLLRKLKIGQLWMHRPWDYSDEMLRYFTDPRVGDNDRLKETLSAMFDLEELVAAKGVRMYDPFKGAQIGAFHVMSPERDWYARSLLSDANASAAGECSVVLLGEIGDRKLLLTGGAGDRALTVTADYAEAAGVSLPKSLKVIQVPHHGTRHKLSPSVLDRLIGSKSPVSEACMIAFVTASGNSKLHPAKMVVDEFLSRGAAIIATNGRSIRHYFNMEARDGWRPIESLPFVQEVDSSAAK